MVGLLKQDGPVPTWPHKLGSAARTELRKALAEQAVCSPEEIFRRRLRLAAEAVESKVCADFQSGKIRTRPRLEDGIMHCNIPIGYFGDYVQKVVQMIYQHIAPRWEDETKVCQRRLAENTSSYLKEDDAYHERLVPGAQRSRMVDPRCIEEELYLYEPLCHWDDEQQKAMRDVIEKRMRNATLKSKARPEQGGDHKSSKDKTKKKSKVKRAPGRPASAQSTLGTNESGEEEEDDGDSTDRQKLLEARKSRLEAEMMRERHQADAINKVEREIKDLETEHVNVKMQIESMQKQIQAVKLALEAAEKERSHLRAQQNSAQGQGSFQTQFHATHMHADRDSSQDFSSYPQPGADTQTMITSSTSRDPSENPPGNLGISREPSGGPAGNLGKSRESSGGPPGNLKKSHEHSGGPAGNLKKSHESSGSAGSNVNTSQDHGLLQRGGAGCDSDAEAQAHFMGEVHADEEPLAVTKERQRLQGRAKELLKLIAFLESQASQVSHVPRPHDVQSNQEIEGNTNSATVVINRPVAKADMVRSTALLTDVSEDEPDETEVRKPAARKGYSRVPEHAWKRFGGPIKITRPKVSEQPVARAIFRRLHDDASNREMHRAALREDRLLAHEDNFAGKMELTTAGLNNQMLKSQSVSDGMLHSGRPEEKTCSQLKAAHVQLQRRSAARKACRNGSKFQDLHSKRPASCPQRKRAEPAGDGLREWRLVPNPGFDNSKVARRLIGEAHSTLEDSCAATATSDDTQPESSRQICLGPPDHWGWSVLHTTVGPTGNL